MPVRDPPNSGTREESVAAGSPEGDSGGGGGGGRALAAATRDLFNEIKSSNAAVTPFRSSRFCGSSSRSVAQMGQGGVYAQQDAEECWGQIVSSFNARRAKVHDLFAIGLDMKFVRRRRTKSGRNT